MNATTKRRQYTNGYHHNATHNWTKIKSAIKDTLGNAQHTAGTMLTDSVADIKKTSTKAKNKVATYTAKKPFKSLGLALLAGVVTGFLLRR